MKGITKFVEVVAIFTTASNYSHVAATNEEIGARVRALLEIRGVGQRDLASHIGIDPSALSRAISGERTFKAREVALLAEYFGVSATAILEGTVDGSGMSIAARQNLDAPGAVQDAVARAGFLLELAEVVDSTRMPWFKPPLRIDGLAWQQGQAGAAELLHGAELDEKPLPGDLHELAALIERAFGVQVSLEPLASGLDGLSITSQRFQLAMVNSQTAPARQRWTLAHELGHLVFGDTAELVVDENVWSGRAPEETRANAFAAAFLMPADLMRSEWGEATEPSDSLIEHLLDTFHVSLDSLAFRLHNLGLVSASGRDQVRRMYPFISMMRNQGHRQGEGSWLPTALTTDVLLAYSEGRIGLRWLAELVQLHPEDLLRRLSSDHEEAAAFEAVDENITM